MILFRAAGVESRSLAALVRSGPHELDARALVSRMLLHPPYTNGETIYRSITAIHAPCIIPAIDDAPAMTSATAVAETRSALEHAVERAFAGVKRVAVLTGGGLDSSALLALAVSAARRSGGSAFGVALDFGGEGDDRPHLAALEAHLGCEILRVRPEEAAHRFALVHEGVDATPLTWPGGAMEIELMARARAHGAERALTGAGADDLFDGEPRALADVARGGELRRATAAARRLRGFGRPRSPIVSWLARPLLARLAPRSLRAWRARHAPLRAQPWLTPLARRFMEEWRDHQIERTYAHDDSARARLTARLTAPHLEHLAWLRHQEEVGSGLERLDPYLDPALVAAITRIPRALLLHGDVRRGLFREALGELLPESLRRRLDKASFEPAFARFVEGAGGFEPLRSLASVAQLGALGLVEPRAFRKAFDAFVATASESTCNGWGTVWPVLAVEAFLATREA